MSSKRFHNNAPTAYGITGGIGSGKSYVCRLLEQSGYPVFYCDDEAKRIIRTSPKVRSELTAVVGEGLYAADGSLVKPRLAAYLCQGPDYAARIDAIVHPRVRTAFLEWLARRNEPKVFMECALLFESGFDSLVDKSVLVSAPTELRIARLMERDGVSREKATEWLNLQMPEEEKARRAHLIIYNDYTPALEREVERMLSVL